ncbi:MAG: DUF2934 domain-containing protein [Deltaproteobacteria bacterium]|nr:DUF2934 domain-containing protein [Deltaproteobacteria bacterium]
MTTTSKKKTASATKNTKQAGAAKATTKAAAPRKAAPKTNSSAQAAAPKATAKKTSGNGTAKRQTKSRKDSDNIITHEMIASKAYDIWAQNGYPHGREMQNWLEAEQALRANA